MRVLPLSCLLLLASATASAGPLYKWKDANGVTQYSERPPQGQKYETRNITHSGVPVAAPAETADANAENPQCTAARHNLQLLAGDNPLMEDSDGDGKPDRPLDESRRASQKQLAESAVSVYCKPAAGK